MSYIPEITDIERLCNTIAGLQSLLLIRQKDVVTVPVSCNPLYISGNITTSKAPINIPLNAKSESYEDEVITDHRAGDYLRYQVNFIVPKGRIEVDTLFYSGYNNYWSCFITQNDGTVRFIQNLRLSRKYTTGANRSEKNAYTVKLYGEHEYNTGIFTGSISSGGAWINNSNQDWISNDGQSWIFN